MRGGALVAGAACDWIWVSMKIESLLLLLCGCRPCLVSFAARLRREPLLQWTATFRGLE